MNKNIIIFSLLLLVTSAKIQATTWHVDQRRTMLSDEWNGSESKPLVTISQAALIAEPGDTVLVYAGIYRERVAPKNEGKEGKPIVYYAMSGHKVIIKGSDIWINAWEQIGKNLFKSKLDLNKFNGYNPFYIKLARKTGRKSLGQVFCNGIEFQQVDSVHQVELLTGTWALSYDSLSVIINYPKEKFNCPIELCEIEYAARGKVFAPHKRGLGYITVQGFTIEHCANQFPSGFYHDKGFPQSGALSTRSGHHWIIKSNTISHAKTLGIDCGYEGAYDNEGNQSMPNPETIGYHLIEYNTISDCGAGGIAGATQRGTVIRYNRIDRTNNLGFTAPETGAIKVHFFYDGIIEGNTFCDNDCSAIWLDNQWYNTRVTRNVIIRSSGHGIFVEMGNGSCLIDNNIIAYTIKGDGIYTHDASGVTIANNLLFANAHFGVYMRVVTDRKAKNEDGEIEVVATRNQIILNNIFIDNYRGHINLPIHGERVTNNISDYNLFINGTQWQWEAAPFYSFALNKNNGMSDKMEREKELEKIWKAVDKSKNSENGINKSYSQVQQPLLTFDQWKMLTGLDSNSETPQMGIGEIENGGFANGDVSLSSHSMELIIRNTKSINSMECPIVEGIESDFFGNHYSGESTLPGPFSYLGSKEVNLFLIPPVIPLTK